MLYIPVLSVGALGVIYVSHVMPKPAYRALALSHQKKALRVVASSSLLSEQLRLEDSTLSYQLITKMK